VVKYKKNMCLVVSCWMLVDGCCHPEPVEGEPAEGLVVWRVRL